MTVKGFNAYRNGTLFSYSLPSGEFTKVIIEDTKAKMFIVYAICLTLLEISFNPL